MPSPRRDLVFRVFVSSTFSDMVVERNALQRDVPETAQSTARNVTRGSRRLTCAGA